MASLDMSKGSDAFNMMGDIFNFLKKYGTAEKPDDYDYWNTVWAEHQKLCDKYKGNKTVQHLLINMMTGVLSHLESEVTTWKE